VKILAFDTATPATAVAVAECVDGSGRSEPQLAVALRDDPVPGARPNHTSRLLELVEQVLADASFGWEELDRIAVAVGPGTFTGLRIGISTAQALARARGLPLVGVSTLDALALPALAQHAGSNVLAVLDARRGEAFAAGYPAHALPGDDAPALKPSVLDPQALETAAAALGEGSLAVGGGAIKFAANLQRAGLLIPPEDSELHRITALAHCRLATATRPGEPQAVQPNYLRLPDAEITRRK
jgi:tRNA threonylcarbamoyladenosine biosynthesis protein TsaB